jgi:hypothetical protein
LDENSEKLLLELALHRYDEEVQRNELIDGNNKSMVAFLGVMLTIQCTIFPRLIEFKVILSEFEINLLFCVFIGSLVFYLSSLLVFMSTLNNFDKIQTVPDIETLIDFEYNNTSLNYIVGFTLINLNECIEDNDEILNEKISKRHIGLELMKSGVISTIIFIILIVLILN